MQRINRAMLRKKVELLNGALGREAGKVGSYTLDIGYGGYRVARLINEQGGERDISDRGSARETANVLDALREFVFSEELNKR
jgi:hypothetical protein